LKSFMGTNVKPSIFISYKRVDKEKVFQIKEQIEAAIDAKCWIDMDGIESDAQFVTVIMKAIEACDVVLFMYSSVHNQITDYENDWTIREIRYASKKKKHIVFVNLDGSILNDYFEFMYVEKQQVNALDPNAINRLIADIKVWLSNSAASSSSTFDETNIETYSDDDVEDTILRAEHGDRTAQFNLGLLFSKGKGVHQSEEEAFRWFLKAAEQDVQPACFNVATYYLKGIGVEQNTQQAILWYTKLADQGMIQAQTAIGALYSNGVGGVAIDLEKAIYWYKKAAAQNHSLAHSLLGECYRKLGDEKNSMKWYMSAAELGDPAAQYVVGNLYYNGETVPQDYNRALYWYEKSAQQGYTWGQYNAGILLASGALGKPDMEKAAYWFEESAKSGYAEGQYNTGINYILGRGVKRNLEVAEKWLTLASSQGLDCAVKALNQLQEDKRRIANMMKK
jgi:TPR repeat protein